MSTRIELPFGKYSFEVKNNDNSVQCDLCDLWYHNNCVDILKKKNETSKTDPLPWFCPFFKTKIPISKVSNSDLKVMLNFTKPNSKAYIKTVMNRTRETMKHFC